jgi:hypothetical protein
MVSNQCPGTCWQSCERVGDAERPDCHGCGGLGMVVERKINIDVMYKLIIIFLKSEPPYSELPEVIGTFYYQPPGCWSMQESG